MASDVDICNLALGYLGDAANVSSINPPDSVQAEHCQRFYPLARDALLDMMNWGFATKRATPSQIAVPAQVSGIWAYAYIAPSDCLNVQRVYDPTQSDDFVQGIPQPYDGFWPGSSSYPASSSGMVGLVTPQAFSVESDSNGDYIIYTNQQNAAISYTSQVTDTTKFGPSFTVALAWLLASYLAGPIIKGTEGIKMAQACLKAFQTAKAAAGESDANERRVTSTNTTIAPWLAGR